MIHTRDGLYVPVVDVERLTVTAIGLELQEQCCRISQGTGTCDDGAFCLMCLYAQTTALHDFSEFAKEHWAKEEDDMLTASQAAEIVGVSSGTIRLALGKADDIITLRTGHPSMVWAKSKVMALLAEREAAGKKKRVKYKKKVVVKDYSPGKSLDFEVNDKGEVVPPKRTFRGRVCRGEGCNEPVSTGHLY